MEFQEEGYYNNVEFSSVGGQNSIMPNFIIFLQNGDSLISSIYAKKYDRAGNLIESVLMDNAVCSIAGNLLISNQMAILLDAGFYVFEVTTNKAVYFSQTFALEEINETVLEIPEFNFEGNYDNLVFSSIGAESTQMPDFRIQLRGADSSIIQVLALKYDSFGKYVSQTDIGTTFVTINGQFLISNSSLFLTGIVEGFYLFKIITNLDEYLSQTFALTETDPIILKTWTADDTTITADNSIITVDQSQVPS